MKLLCKAGFHRTKETPYPWTEYVNIILNKCTRCGKITNEIPLPPEAFGKFNKEIAALNSNAGVNVFI